MAAQPDGDSQSIEQLREAGKGLPTEEILSQLLYAVRQLPRARRYRPSYNPWGVKTALTPTADTPLAVSAPAFAGVCISPVDTPDDKDERDWVITWRLHALPPSFGGSAPSTTCGVVQVIITYTQGQANYTIGPFSVVDTQHHTLPFTLTARKVTVTAKWSGVTFGAFNVAPSPIFFSASAGETHADHDQGLAATPPTWFRTPAALYIVPGGGGAQKIASANAQVPVPSSGAFKGLVGSVVTSAAGATTPVYIMLFDAPLTAAAPNAGALPLWTTDPIVPLQGTSSFDVTGQTNWNYGLWVGISSTPGVYTPVAGSCACDVAGG